MRKIILAGFLLVAGSHLKAQKVDQIFFHLYTDSLKKGTHNYINVDGKLSNGQWLPMTSKEIELSASSCSFSGNDLVIPANFSGDTIRVRAMLRGRPETAMEKTIWIKKLPDPDILPTKDEVLKPSRKRRG